MNIKQRNVLTVLNWCLSSRINDTDLLMNYSESEWEDIFGILWEHSIVPLSSNILPHIPEEYVRIRNKWKNIIYANVYEYYRLIKQQEHILDLFRKSRVYAVVIKGTSAAQYYPNPNLRTMGDIDLLVKDECYDSAVDILRNLGFAETTASSEVVRGRHRSFYSGGVSVELHHYFVKYFGTENDYALERLIEDSIPETISILPDEVNGIILLAHIKNHLIKGLGLRQVIDWMMFVRSRLNDEMWFYSFQKKAQSTGLETLAITITKMCQKYLGLSTDNTTWCKNADEKLCDNLIDYVMECGNFGRSRGILQSTSVEKFPKPSNPVKLFKYIQFHGESNMKSIKIYPWLRPFAWIYQTGRYMRMAIQHKVGVNRLKCIYIEGQKRNEMFAALGLLQ